MGAARATADKLLGFVAGAELFSNLSVTLLGEVVSVTVFSGVVFRPTLRACCGIIRRGFSGRGAHGLIPILHNWD